MLNGTDTFVICCVASGCDGAAPIWLPLPLPLTFQFLSIPLCSVAFSVASSIVRTILTQIQCTLNNPTEEFKHLCLRNIVASS